MTKLEELEKKLEECQKEIEELKKNENKSKRWKPKDGEIYYCISQVGTEQKTQWYDTALDRYRYEKGEVKKTEKEVIDLIHNLETKMLLQKYADEHNEEEIDWENEKQEKFHMRYDIKNKIIMYSSSNIYKLPDQIYFTSSKIMADARKKIGEDRIIKYLKEM